MLRRRRSRHGDPRISSPARRIWCSAAPSPTCLADPRRATFRATRFASIRWQGCSGWSRRASGGPLADKRSAPPAQPGDRPRCADRRARRPGPGPPRHLAASRARRAAPIRSLRPGRTSPLAERRARLIAEARPLVRRGRAPGACASLFPRVPAPIFCFDRLASDWASLGIAAARAPAKAVAADLRLVDAVAPSISPAWFVRKFRCGDSPDLRSAEADELLDAARAAPVAAQRAALLAEAARLIDEAALFLPIAAPIRWSLVSPTDSKVSPRTASPATR